MLPVLPPGTTILGFTWRLRPKVGDVVVFCHDNKEKIKRIDKIDDGKIFVLGDNLSASTDSRAFGYIDNDEVIAKVVWPHVAASRIEKSY